MALPLGDDFEEWERLESMRQVRPRLTGIQASAVLAAVQSAAADAEADGAFVCAGVLRRAAVAIQREVPATVEEAPAFGVVSR